VEISWKKFSLFSNTFLLAQLLGFLCIRHGGLRHKNVSTGWLPLTLLTWNLTEEKASVTLALASRLRRKAQLACRSWDQFNKICTFVISRGWSYKNYLV
jgi:hypothetical protein